MPILVKYTKIFYAVFPVNTSASLILFLLPYSCDMNKPAITIVIPIIFCNVSLSLIKMKEKKAVKIGMQFEKTVDFDIPILPTE